MDHTPTTGVTPDDLPFANDALRLLAEADAEADRLGHEYVGAEHLVLAMTRPPTSAAAAVLANRGVDPLRVHQSLAGLVAPGARGVAAAPRPYTSRTQRAFAHARDSAQELGHARVKSVHLLVGVLREGMNPAAQVLQHHGLTAGAALEEARALVANGNAP